MKVELTFSFDTIIAIDKQLQKIYELPISNNKRDNFVKSIGFDLAAKFQTKRTAIKKNASLFDQKKRFKMSLKFHEACGLQEILSDPLLQLDNALYASLIEKTIHNLDQKTC